MGVLLWPFGKHNLPQKSKSFLLSFIFFQVHYVILIDLMLLISRKKEFVQNHCLNYIPFVPLQQGSLMSWFDSQLLYERPCSALSHPVLKPVSSRTQLSDNQIFVSQWESYLVPILLNFLILSVFRVPHSYFSYLIPLVCRKCLF